MVDNLVARVRDELQGKHIYVPNGWLDSLAGEQANSEPFNFAFCYSKWLNTNLLELDYSTVQISDPITNQSLQATCPMNATFQIVQVKDAAQPVPNDYCEELYQKKANDYELNDDEEVTGFIENPERDNQNVQQDSDNRPVSQPKNRHLLLELFNGKQMFRAFEYEPINHLNFQNCYPGAKVSIRGEVWVSLGVMLLRPRNISPLGGIRLESVDSPTNNTENQESNEATARPN